MKRAFEKTICVVGIVLAVLFIAVVLLTSFNVINSEEFNNGILKAVFLVLAVLYGISAMFSAYFVFSTGDELKEVLVYNRQDSTTRVTKGVIKKLAKQSLKNEQGVKVKAVKVVLTDRGLNLRITIKTDSVDIPETTAYLKNILVDVFGKILLIKFKNIDFKLVGVKTSYEAPRAEIRSATQEDVDRTPQLVGGSPIIEDEKKEEDDKIDEKQKEEIKRVNEYETGVTESEYENDEDSAVVGLSDIKGDKTE